MCEGACEALALVLLAAGVPSVVAIFGVQGWRWAWACEVRALVGALDADAAGEQAVRRRHGQDGCLVTASSAARGAKSARFNAG